MRRIIHGGGVNIAWKLFYNVGLPAGWNAASESGGSGHGPCDSTSSNGSATT